MYHEMLPPEVLEFQQELKHWPMISAEMQTFPDLPTQLGACAARLGILLDGVYVPLDLMKMLTKKLYEMRTSAIYVPSSEFTEVQIREGENSVTIERVPSPSLKKAD